MLLVLYIFKNSFKGTLYVFSYILDDSIINSWCPSIFNIPFDVFHCIWCFDQNFGRLIDLRSQNLVIDIYYVNMDKRIIRVVTTYIRLTQLGMYLIQISVIYENLKLIFFLTHKFKKTI